VDRDAGLIVVLLAAEYQMSRKTVLTRELGKAVQPLEETRIERSSGFDLDGVKVPPVLNQEVDFVALVISEEIQIWDEAAVCSSLEHFHDYPILEDGSAQRVGREL